MNTAPRNLPRFLPTLTEVVHPSTLVQSAAPITPDREEAVWFVMQRVDILIERRLREEADAILRTLVAEQLQTLSDRLRPELEAFVRRSVADALTVQAEAHKTK